MSDNDMLETTAKVDESPSGAARGRASDPQSTRRRVTLADGVRYQVLRRLVAGLRHAMLGKLQVVQGLADAASHMLGANPDPDRAAERLGRITQQCADVVRSYDATVEWLRPDACATAMARECIDRCIHLAEAEWILRGISATTRSADICDAHVHKASFEQLVVTALLVATDNQKVASQVLVHASVDGAQLSVHIRTVPSASGASLVRSDCVLTCADLQDLAWSHAVAVDCSNDEIRLLFPVVETAGTAPHVGC